MIMIKAIYSIETVIAIVIALVSTELLKLALDYALAVQRESFFGSLRSGADIRRLHPGLAALLLPLVPILFAANWAVFSELAPAMLEPPFASSTGWQQVGVLLGWGALCGVLASFLFSYVQGIRNALRNNRAG